MIIQPDFLDHWKTRTLEVLLQDEKAPIYLIRLWSHCQNRKKWIFEDMPKQGVAAVCHFRGDPDFFAEQLESLGFIKISETGVEVCGFAEYNSQLIAAWKNGKMGGRPQKKNPQVTQGVTHGVTDKIREDKIREEKRRVNKPPTPKGEIDLPENLQTDQFRDAWAEWKKYRTEIRKPLKPTTEKSQLKKFAAWGPAKATAAIRRSIENGWQGIFEPDAKCLVPDDSTPYPEIADIFNKHCGERLAPIQHASDTRKALMTELYRRLGKDLKRVDEYFARVAASNKLMGRYGGHKSTADWLLRWDNAARVLDGQFDNM